MLDFHKDNNALLYKKYQENVTKKYVRIFGHSIQFCNFGIYGNYIRDQISYSPFTFGGMFYTTKKKKKKSGGGPQDLNRSSNRGVHGGKGTHPTHNTPNTYIGSIEVIRPTLKEAGWDNKWIWVNRWRVSDWI